MSAKTAKFLKVALILICLASVILIGFTDPVAILSPEPLLVKDLSAMVVMNQITAIALILGCVTATGSLLCRISQNQAKRRPTWKKLIFEASFGLSLLVLVSLWVHLRSGFDANLSMYVLDSKWPSTRAVNALIGGVTAIGFGFSKGALACAESGKNT